jgi:3D (Asp-Asp-Asp) domain-containing protein
MTSRNIIIVIFQIEGNDLLLRLEKYVCITYICAAIVLGGVSAYYMVTLSEMNSNSTTKKNDNNGILQDNSEDNLIKTATPIKAELTAYCNCKICSEAWGSQTAMQTHTRVGIIAVPKDIPLGSKIYIPDLKSYNEDGIFYSEDRGGAVVVKGDGTHIIDIWLPTHEQVKEFGRKKTMVYLMR